MFTFRPTARTRLLAVLCLFLNIIILAQCPIQAAEYTVKTDGSGSFTTIQACADAAKAGDTCLVSPGVYNEHVRTMSGGTSDATRVTYKAQGAVTMQGFDIRHPHVSVDGFDITGYALQYYGHITVLFGGSNCQILNNTIRDGVSGVLGIYFYSTKGQTASNCIVRGNRLTRLSGCFLALNGDGQLIENNVFEYQNSMDYIRLFGANHVIRRNVFWRGSSLPGTGNHPDFVQAFGGAGSKSENHLLEENWIQDLESQFTQIISGDGVVTNGILYDNVKNITFRRNVIASVSANGNMSLPNARFENNTFYRLAYELSGITYGGSLTRGDGSYGVLKNNVFLAGGSRASTVNDLAGYYGIGGAPYSREVISVFVTKDKDSNSAITVAIFDELRRSGYIDSNGILLDKAKALTGISQFVFSDQYSAYRQDAYDNLVKTGQLDSTIRNTFSADYNYVAGSQVAGFPAKRSSECIPGSGTGYTLWNFCEPHGINGGDPKLANLANPLGPDGVPFTIDDGLKPLPGSSLCGKGEGGADIGAYSCDPGTVFSGNAGPKAPTDLRIEVK